MAEKESFLLHTEDFTQIGKLKDSDAGKLLKAILTYVETGALPDKLCVRGETMFDYIRRRLDRDRESYQETCRRRSEAGKKGGRPRKEPVSEEGTEKAKKAIGFSEKQEKAMESKKSLPDPDPEYDPDPDPVARLGPGWQSRTASPIPPPDPQKAQEERIRRVKYLNTMLNLYHCGALVDPEEERRYRRELEELTGGSL